MKKKSFKILIGILLILLMLMPYLEVSASTIYYIGTKTLGAKGDTKVIKSDSFKGGNERTGTVPTTNSIYDKSAYYRYITTVSGITPPVGAGTNEIFIRDIKGDETTDAHASFYCLDPTKPFPPSTSGTTYTSAGLLSEMTDAELKNLITETVTVNDLRSLLKDFYYSESINQSTYQTYFEKAYKDRLLQSLADEYNTQDKLYQYLTDDDIKVIQQWALWEKVSQAKMGTIIQRDLNGTGNDDTPTITDEGFYKSERNAFMLSLLGKLSAGLGSEVEAEPVNNVTLQTNLSHVNFVDEGVEYVDLGTYKIGTSLLNVITDIRLYDKENNDVTESGEYQIFVGEEIAMGTNYGTPITGNLNENRNNTNLLNHEFFLRFSNPEKYDSVKMVISYVKQRSVDGEIFVSENDGYQNIIKIETRPLVEVLTSKYDITPKENTDLALRKFITHINEEAVDSREPVLSEVNAAINKGSQTTAHYAHKKNPLLVEHGDTVRYKMRIYNESTIDGHLTSVTDILPAGLSLKTGAGINENWTQVEKLSDGRTIIKYINNPSVKIPGAVLEAGDYKMSSIDITVDILIDNDAPAGIELTNIAFINQQEEDDIDSLPGNVSKDGLNNLLDITNSNLPNYRGHGNDSQTLDQPTWYYKGYEDDDDFEKVILRPFDLALRKYITDVNGTAHDREPVVDVAPLISGSATTATYTHPKNSVLVEKGDVVTYKIRVYNEGGLAGYVTQIKDHIPSGLGFILNHKTNIAQGWTLDETKAELTEAEKLEMPFLTRVDLTKIAPKDENGDYDTNSNATTAAEIDIVKGDVAIITDFAKSKLLPAFNSALGSDGLSYVDVEIASIVLDDRNGNNLRNVAEISGFTDEDGKPIIDRDSVENDLIPGRIDGPYDDDEDYEALHTVAFDLALRKFITNVNDDGNPNTSGDSVDRAPVVNTDGLVDGSKTTATYSHPKTPVMVQKGDLVTYTIRVYNEGMIDGYVKEIRDFLPKGLAYLPQHKKNIDNEWVVESGTNSTVADYPKLDIKLRENDMVGVTDLSKAILIADSPVITTKLREDHLLKKFTYEKGDELDFVDVEIVAVVLEDRQVDSNEKYTGNLKNWAEIVEDADGNDNPISDRDSTPGDLNKHPDGPYEDDEDFEDLATEPMVFDLALQKFISQIDSTAEVRKKTSEQLADRVPEAKIDSNNKITYTKKDTKPPLVGYKDIVTYTIRVYNEGDIAGFAKKVRDTIPEGLTYLPENATNLKYQWYFIDAEGNKVEDIKKAKFIETEYLSRDEAIKRESKDIQPDVDNTILKAFDKDNKVISYKDLQIVFTVNEKATPGAKNLKNIAEISDDEDEDGNPVDDIDSTPGNEKPGEDDIDDEDLEVTYFDLALLKIVTNVELTENGKVKDIATGHTFDMIPEPVVKTDLDERYLDKTEIKYTYKIRVMNEGLVEGYATEVSDYIPDGLEFYEEDQKNNKWSKVEGEAKRVITTDLADVLLKPGESATVEIVLRWINDKNNMGVLTNVAEISKDHNEQELPDIDSIPGNRKPGEDDIDDASVIVAIRTGAAETFFMVSLTMSIIVGLGTVLIKKYII